MSDEQALVKRGVMGLFIANAVSFAMVGVSYVAYSHLLVASELGLYAAALMIGTFGAMVLDAGLENAIIKSKTAPTEEQCGALVTVLLCISLLLVGLLCAARGLIEWLRPELRRDYLLLAGFGAIYVLSYPFIMVPTALMERRLRYGHIAWIESVGVVIERALPIVFIVSTSWGMYSFLVALLIGRTFRAVAWTIVRPVRLCFPFRQRIKSLRPFIVEGAWLQLATAASLIRDNLHVLLVGPWFGKVWTGYYAWGMQLCILASQAFVQIASRISIPMFARESLNQRRWDQCIAQIQWLARLIAPVLVAMYFAIPSIDARFFGSRWEPAIVLLPFLFIRMLPGIATTPLGALVMVQRAGKRYAIANATWSALEIVGAVLCLKLLGPVGLAWSYALMVWPALWLFSAGVSPDGNASYATILRAVVLRPGLAVAGLLALAGYGLFCVLQVHHFPLIAAGAIVIVLAAYASERKIRELLLPSD